MPAIIHEQKTVHLQRTGSCRASRPPPAIKIVHSDAYPLVVRLRTIIAICIFMYNKQDLYIGVQVDIIGQEYRMPSETHAVLLADVMESRARKDIRSLLGKNLAAASRRHLQQGLIKLPYSITAGDEFQTIATSPSSIPAVILDLRRALRPLSLRIGIGVGEISDRIQPPVNRLGGEAFQSARTAIDNIKAQALFKFEVLTAFETPDRHFNETINLLYGLHDTLVLKITPKQWQAIEQFLDRPTLRQTAKRLNLDISTVSRNLKRGYYWQLSETAKIAGSIIKDRFR
jgi:hypothetical protein